MKPDNPRDGGREEGREEGREGGWVGGRQRGGARLLTDVDWVSLMSTELLTLQDGGLVKMTGGGELEVTTLGRATMKGKKFAM